jgi:hypothetical protein
VRPLAFDVAPLGAGFQQQHVEPTLGELLRDDRPAGACADDDHVTPSAPAGDAVLLIDALPIAFELLVALRDA